MRKLNKTLTLSLAGALFVGGISNAGTLEELKQLLNQQQVDINIALTGDYIYTANRDDNIGGTSGYEDTFGYNAYIGLFKEATQQSPFGFGLGIGNEWTPVVGIEPLPTDNNQVKIHEAYVEAKLAYFDIKAGRILTNIGGEAPFSWQNVNIQRGLLWNGEPVFYNGVRISAEYGQFSGYIGVNDRDTSDGKMALEAGVSTSLPYKVDASFNVLLPDSKDETKTRVYNLTLNIGYIENLPLTFYVDYLDKPQPGDNAQSWGAALLGEYKVNEKISIGGRVEYVNNDGDGDNYDIGKGNNAVTFTITPKYRFNKYLYIRGEASYVKLGNKYYQKKANDPKSKTDNEFRLAAEIGFVF